MAWAREKRVKAAVKAIRAFHALGQALVEGRKPAAAPKVIPDTRAKARLFVHPDKGYTAAELDQLCQLIETTQPGQADTLGMFGRTYLIRLLSVPKGERVAFQKKAVRKGWSTADLEAAQVCEGWRRWLKRVRPPEGGTTPARRARERSRRARERSHPPRRT